MAPGFWSDPLEHEEEPMNENGPWKKHFAWKPVITISGRKMWFKTCYRREVQRVVIIGMAMAMKHSTEYGDAFDILKS